MFEGITNALRGGGPQDINPQAGGGMGNSMGGPLGRMLGGPDSGRQIAGMMMPGGLIGFIQRMLARRRQQQPQMPGAAPAQAPAAPAGPQNIMAPPPGTPGSPGAVY